MTRTRLAVLFAFLALLTQGANAAAGLVVHLNQTHRAATGEALVLRVHAGVLRRGMAVEVYDDHGSLLGTVSPFAVHSGQEAGTYTIPLGGRLAGMRRFAVRLVLTQAGQPPRAPTRRELRGVTTAFIAVTN